MTGALVFHGSVRRGDFELSVRIEAEPGEVVAVLGPNASGKSTLLRTIAGLIPLSSGRLLVGGRVLDDPAIGTFHEPAARRVGLVFQDGRLFGHMRVVDNVAFGLRASGCDRATARRAAYRWLTVLGIEHLAERRPRELSGGQAQRVALARALASEPDVLLLDEPFAALDVQTRAHVQSEMKRHLAEFAGPTLLVTHDAVEALMLADRIVVLEDGRVVQQGTPTVITTRPATPYVAKLVGMNLYEGDADGQVVRLAGGGRLVVADTLAPGPALVALRPSAITVHGRQPDASSARNIWPGRVAGLQSIADRVRLNVAGEPPALVDVTAAAVAELGLAPGVDIWLAAKATDVSAYTAL